MRRSLQIREAEASEAERNKPRGGSITELSRSSYPREGINTWSC